ncbi:hypothetical protein D3C81_1269140 [compost metagenome]
MGDAEQVVQARVEVQHTEAHIGTEAEHRGDDAEAIHRVADGAIDALADQRIQRRAQGQWQVMPVGKVGQRHADKGEHAPAMQAPVQKQNLHRLARSICRTGLALGRLQHVGQRLGHAEEKQGDADPGGEQHAGPGQITEFGFVVVGTELDLAVAGQGGDHHEDQIQGHRQHVVPADRVGRPVLRRQQPGTGLFGHGDDNDTKQQNETRREPEHRRIHADQAAWRDGRCTHVRCTSKG